MTRPVQEPTPQRSISGAEWATSQLARRPEGYARISQINTQLSNPLGGTTLAGFANDQMSLGVNAGWNDDRWSLDFTNNIVTFAGGGTFWAFARVDAEGANPTALQCEIRSAIYPGTGFGVPQPGLWQQRINADAVWNLGSAFCTAAFAIGDWPDNQIAFDVRIFNSVAGNITLIQGGFLTVWVTDYNELVSFNDGDLRVAFGPTGVGGFP